MDFNEAVRQQEAYEQRQAQAAASSTASRLRSCERRLPEAQKALRDLAQHCEQNQVPKFEFRDSPPKMHSLKWKVKYALTWDRTPSPVGFAFYVGGGHSTGIRVPGNVPRMDDLQLLLPEGKLWHFKRDRTSGKITRGYIDITADDLAGLAGVKIGGRYIRVSDDGSSLVTSAGRDEDPEAFVNHLARVASGMRNPNTHLYADMGLRQVG